MAKLLDKLYNRLIEGKLTIQEGDDTSEATKNNPRKFSLSDDFDSFSDDFVSSLKYGDLIFSTHENCVALVTYASSSLVKIIFFDSSENTEQEMIPILGAYSYEKSGSTFNVKGGLFDLNTIYLSYLMDDSANEGKFLVVDSEGRITTASVSGGGGTQLYKHVITFEDGADNKNRIVTLILPFSTPIVKYSSQTYGSGWTFGDVTSGEANRNCVLGTTLTVFVSGNQTPDMYCFVDDLPNTTSLRLFNINQDAYLDVVSVSDTVTTL